MSPRIDPHAHTTASDGTDSPTELLEQAARAGLDVVGITDHDTTAGWEEGVAAVAKTGVALLRGVEISCSDDGITVHLLAFLHEAGHSCGLDDLMADSRAQRIHRAEAMTDRLARDFPISFADVTAQAAGARTIGRPHIADALVAAGVVPDRSAAFAELLHPASPYYVRYLAPNPVEVTELVRQAGGVPVLAHPRARTRQRRFISEKTIANMARAGLFALEVQHRDHDDASRAEVQQIAESLGLYTTGGSDYHGTGKPNRLGENLTSERVLTALEQEAQMRVIRP